MEQLNNVGVPYIRISTVLIIYIYIYIFNHYKNILKKLIFYNMVLLITFYL